MVPDQESRKAGGSSDFPSTRWHILEAVRGPVSAEHREVLNELIGRYWKPVYVYICRRGHHQEAADLTQEFFVHWLRKELFERADRARGQFRKFLLACLNNFLIDATRRVRRRRPTQGIVSIHRLLAKEELDFEPAENETPEALFCRAWVSELLHRVWASLQRQFEAFGQQVHCELFRQRIFEPALSGNRPPPMRDLCRQYGLTEKQACNRLVTVRRAFGRLLREEIKAYASSEEEITSEVRELFRLAADR